MVNLSNYDTILTNLDRQKKRSFGAIGDSQSSQGSVAKSLRRDRNLERTALDAPLRSSCGGVGEEDPLLENLEFVKNPFDTSYDQEIEDIITQMDNASTESGPVLKLRLEFSCQDFFWKGALLVFWGYGDCAQQCTVTARSTLARADIAPFLERFVHQHGGSSLTAVCSCAFRRILSLPKAQSYATLPACVIHVLPAFIGLSSLKGVYAHHKTIEVGVQSQPALAPVPGGLGDLVHRTSPFLQLQHPVGTLPGPAPYQRIASELWVKYCVTDRHHYPESSFAFFKPGKAGTRTLLHLKGRPLRISLLGTDSSVDVPAGSRKHRSHELWTDVMRECFDLQVVDFPEHPPLGNVTCASHPVQTSHGVEHLNLFSDPNFPEVVVCLNGISDVKGLHHKDSLRSLVEANVPFVVVSWLLKSYENATFWSIAEYNLASSVKRHMAANFSSVAPSVIRGTINDDLGTGYWDDDTTVTEKRVMSLNSEQDNTSLSDDSTNPSLVALCVSGGTWERYPAFPGTALATLGVLNFGLCVNLGQILLHQLLAAAHGNLSLLLGENALSTLASTVCSVMNEPNLFKCVAIERSESSNDIVIKHKTISWGRGPAWPARAVEGRLVALPTEIDAWHSLTSSFDVESHKLWSAFAELMHAELGPALRRFKGKERFRTLRKWFIRTREMLVAYEAEPLTVESSESREVMIRLTKYCSTQRLRNRQEQCCAEVTQALERGEGNLWSGENLKPVNSVVRLIVDSVLATTAEMENQSEPERELLRTIRAEFDKGSPVATPAGPGYASQLGLRPIDVELSEQLLDRVFMEDQHTRVCAQLKLNTHLLAQFAHGELWNKRGVF